MNKELQEAAERFAVTIQTKENTLSRLNAIEWFKAGAKWQEERMSIELEQLRIYPQFILDCINNNLPPLDFESYKNLGIKLKQDETQ
jgi:hypothetical protein